MNVGGAARAPAADEQPPRRGAGTAAVIGAAMVASVLALGLLNAGRSGWTPEERDLAATGPFVLWLMVLTCLTVVAVLAIPWLAAGVREHRAALAREPGDWRRIRRGVWVSAFLLVGFTLAIVTAPAATSPLPEVIPLQRLRVFALTLVALVAALLAAVSIWLIRGRVERLARAPVSADTVQTFIALRAQLDRLLAFLGATVGLAVLGSATLRTVTLLHGERNDAGVEFPAANVVVYGVALSLLLATVSGPTLVTSQRVGAWLRDRLAPFPAADDPEALDKGLAHRAALDELLSLRLSSTAVFRVAVSLFSPLIGSLAGLLTELIA